MHTNGQVLVSILVGVLLYAVTLSQFTGIAVQHAAREKWKQHMELPIESHDFHCAVTLLTENHSTTLDLKEFIVADASGCGRSKTN